MEEIKADTYYQLRNGEKAFVFGTLSEKFNTAHPVRGYNAVTGDSLCWTLGGRYDYITQGHAHDIISEWVDEPEPETIKVSEMFVGLYYVGNKFRATGYYEDKNIAIAPPLVAIVTVAEWQKIQAGESKLIVGEGL